MWIVTRLCPTDALSGNFVFVWTISHHLLTGNHRTFLEKMFLFLSEHRLELIETSQEAPLPRKAVHISITFRFRSMSKSVVVSQTCMFSFCMLWKQHLVETTSYAKPPSSKRITWYHYYWGFSIDSFHFLAQNIKINMNSFQREKCFLYVYFLYF